jgi:hypothetical protein
MRRCQPLASKKGFYAPADLEGPTFFDSKDSRVEGQQVLIRVSDYGVCYGDGVVRIDVLL